MLRSEIRSAFRNPLPCLRILGVLALPALATAGAVVPATQDLGQAQIGTPGSTPVTLTYTFPGLAGTASFSFVYGRDFAMGRPICSGAVDVTCSVAVVFKPVFPGIRQDAVVVTGANGGVIATTLLHGIGLGPAAAIYPGVISTFAGTGTWGFSGDGQAAANAAFRNPQGVAVDPVGNVFIADSINQVVRKISISTGIVSTVAGVPLAPGYYGDGGQATQAKLNTPVAVAVDGAGNLYIADQGNNAIRKVNGQSGVITTVAGGGRAASGADGLGDGGPATQALLSGPADVALDAAGNLYIADAFHGLIRRVDAVTGAITTVAGGGYNPGSDGFGDGAPATQAALNNPTGVAVDSTGNLYIADTGHNLVRVVNAVTGVIQAVAGTGNPGYRGDIGPAVNALLSNPSAVRVDAAGNIYIADAGNSAVRRIQAVSGVIYTVAGTGAGGYFGDGGSPLAANLANPSGIAVDAAGNLYIADYSNNVVRKITLQAPSLVFGNTNIGQASSLQLLRIDNTGNQPLNFSAISVTTNFQQQASGYQDCSTSNALASGSSCMIGIAFVPTAAGTITGGVSITTNSLNSSTSASVAVLMGTGVLGPVPKAVLSAVNIGFGNQAIGSASTAQAVMLTNAGAAPLGITGIWLTGANSTEFGLSTTCANVLAAGASCTVSLSFLPAGTGARSASLAFSDSVAGSPQTVSLSGTGTSSPKIALAPASVDFGTQRVKTSAARSITLTNTGTAALSISSIAVAGSAAGFSLASKTCGTSVAAGQSCAITVAFSPSKAGRQAASLVVNSSASSGSSVVALTGGAGTGAADFAVWRRSNGTWFVNTGKQATAQQWGLPGDIPVRADYDGDGKNDFAVWRPVNGTWFVIPSGGGAVVTQQWGLPGDIPVPGDYDGDGKTDFAVWRPSNGTWFVIPSGGGPIVMRQWGLPGDVPVPGDYDGDGKTDFAVWRPANGTWFVIPSGGGGAIVQQWGLPGDTPIPGDYDGDGKTDFAVWRSINGTWFIIPSGNPTKVIVQQWGLKNDIPITKDFNGDGKSDLGIWRASNGTWYVLTMDSLSSYPNPAILQQWGLPGDVPL